MKKVLFFDIDGTLVDFDGTIPESAKCALQKARDNGHIVVICSGRSRFQISSELKELSDGLVCCAGAYVECNDKVVHEELMPKDAVRKILSVFNEAGGELAGMTDEYLVMNASCRKNLTKRFEDHGGGEELVKLVLGKEVISDHLDEFDDLRKVLYYKSNWSVDDISEALKDYCDVTPSSYEKKEVDSGEISYIGINKAFGMEKFLNYVGLTREDSIAFGDGPNDMEMIEYAAVGVCMGNGREELKEKADFITKDIKDDGIEFAMKELGLI